jgi:hypothetical protein
MKNALIVAISTVFFGGCAFAITDSDIADTTSANLSQALIEFRQDLEDSKSDVTRLERLEESVERCHSNIVNVKEKTISQLQILSKRHNSVSSSRLNKADQENLLSTLASQRLRLEVTLSSISSWSSILQNFQNKNLKDWKLVFQNYSDVYGENAARKKLSNNIQDFIDKQPWPGASPHGKSLLIADIKVPLDKSSGARGYITIPFGSEVKVLASEGTRVQIAHRNFPPFWIESYYIADGGKSQEHGVHTIMISKPFNPAEALFALQENNMNKLIEMRDHDFEQHEYAQYYTDLLASLIEAKSKLTTAKSSFALVQSEVKRLLWNARVAEQPKLLDSDTRYHNSRGRDLRMQASRIEADAKTLIDDAEEDERNAKSDLVDLLKRWSGAESKTGLPPQD